MFLCVVLRNEQNLIINKVSYRKTDRASGFMVDPAPCCKIRLFLRLSECTVHASRWTLRPWEGDVAGPIETHYYIYIHLLFTTKW